MSSKLGFWFFFKVRSSVLPNSASSKFGIFGFVPTLGTTAHQTKKTDINGKSTHSQFLCTVTRGKQQLTQSRHSNLAEIIGSVDYCNSPQNEVFSAICLIFHAIRWDNLHTNYFNSLKQLKFLAWAGILKVTPSILPLTKTTWENSCLY